MGTYDIYGRRRGDIWEPDEQFERRVRRQREARELAELNQRLAEGERTLRQVRRLADRSASPDENYDDGAGFDETKDEHGPAFVDKHVHGKWEAHSHAGTSSHAGVKVNPGGAVAGQMSEPRRRARQVLEQGLRQGTILGETPPQTAQYSRKPGSIEDEGDVAADEGTDDGSSGQDDMIDTTSGLKLDPERNVHGPMVGQHKHGQFALHLHDGTTDGHGNADHSRAALKAGPLLGQNY